MAITVTFDPPLPSDSPSVFNTKAFTLLGDLNDWSTEANSLASTVSSNASTSTTNASNASTSADAAATSASNAAASYDSFDDRYLGSKSSAPTLDNDGAALLTGALYWDSVLSAMFVRTSGGAWTALNASTGIAQAITVNSSSAALTVTQTGAGNAFVVEDSASTDSTPFVIDANGRVVVGGTASVTTRLLEIQDTGSAPFALVQTSDTSTNASWMDAYRKRATGPVVQSGDRLGGARFFGNDGTNYIEAARLLAEVDGTPGPSDMPGRLVFSTTADGASSPTERMRIDSAGNVGIGGAATAQQKLRIAGTYPGGTGYSFPVDLEGVIDPSVASTAVYMVYSHPTVSAGTLPDLRHFSASPGAFTGTVTTQYGFIATSALTGATNNYGFYSNIAAATNRYNFYAAGTADNYFAGKVGIGIAPVASTGIYQVQVPTGAVTCYGHLSTQTIQSDVTSAFRGFQTNIGTAAAAFTISAVNHFLAGQATLGASSAITTQVGFLSGGANIGATTNIGFTAENTEAVTAGKAAYGFYSAVNIASGGGSTYGFYAAGTAPNYFGGNVTVGGGGTLGYGAGSGGTVTQATSKSTSVTLNKPSGQITMHNAALAAGASVSFQLNNTAIDSGDVVVANGYAVGTSYIFEVQSVGSGAASIRVTNVTGGSLSDALGINFNVIKGSAT